MSSVQTTLSSGQVQLVMKGSTFTFREKTKEGRWVQSAKVTRRELARTLMLTYYRVSPVEVDQALVTLRQRVEQKYAADVARRERMEAEYAATR